MSDMQKEARAGKRLSSEITADKTIDAIGAAYHQGHSIRTISWLYGQSRAHVNWAIDEYGRRRRKHLTRQAGRA
jgi:hypothetical protein